MAWRSPAPPMSSLESTVPSPLEGRAPLEGGGPLEGRAARARGGGVGGTSASARPRPHGRGGPLRKPALQDAAFLVGAVGLSAALYVTGLGFYSDDWTVVGYAGMSADQTFMGIFRAIYGDLVQMRPVQFLYLAGLYKVFGLDPLGYHVVNTLVLAAGAVLFYLVLRELREPRVLAL